MISYSKFIVTRKISTYKKVKPTITPLVRANIFFQINFVQQILVLLEGLLPSMRKSGDDDDVGGGSGGSFFKKSSARRINDADDDEDSDDEGFGVKVNKKKAEVRARVQNVVLLLIWLCHTYVNCILIRG